MSLAIRPSIIVACTVQVLFGAAAAQTLPSPLTDAEVREVTAAIAAMKRDPRGPYLRIRWFCADGTIHPPAGTPCTELGGGVQHAEHSQLGLRLHELDLHVGTLLQGTPAEELIDAQRDYFRLKELILSQYLFETDDGWVLRQARFYRGARQIEDEERRGTELLEKLLSNRDWTAQNYLLANLLVQTVPHLGGRATGTATIRNLASELAAANDRLQPLRVKIHSFPSREDLATVDSILAARPDSALIPRLQLLRDELRNQYDPQRMRESLDLYHHRLWSVLGDALLELRDSYAGEDRMETFGRIAQLQHRVRKLVTSSSNGRTNLHLLELASSLHEQALILGQEIATMDRRALSRTDEVHRLSDYFTVAVGAGFLSPRQQRALEASIHRLQRAESVTALEYKETITYLSRSLNWATAMVRGTFGPVYQRYARVEPKAASFIDAVVRGSVLLPLSAELGRLDADADRQLGASHEILGTSMSQGARGLNPGVAQRVLEIADPQATHPELDTDKIYVLPATTSELDPVAGVLTLDEGNLLSHVQLLARNLGIPNAAVFPDLLPRLQSWRGREVFFAVSPFGRVILKDPYNLTPRERALVADSVATVERIALDVSRLQLDQTQPLPLDKLRARDSGIVVGPKAANLGQLAAYFPDRVAPGLALPFGMFVRHVDRPFESELTVLEELRRAYRQANDMRAAGVAERDIDAFMFGALEQVRRAILELQWIPDVRAAVVASIEQVFGPDLSRGMFIRSDTNVEDLPQFSGAGLNLTVPHRRNLDDVLTAIKRVWTSPFSERAYLWRKQILADQGQVYPSVLLLESVHSEKSGVLITAGLEVGGPDDLTIATAEGVGGAVEGEDAEVIVVDSIGQVRLLSQAQAPSRRALVDSGAGGVAVVPSERPDFLLAESDIAQLRAVVADWERQFAPTDSAQVWDIEFGFERGKLWLFQIRPFIRFRSSDLLGRLSTLDEEILFNAQRRVHLREPIQ